MPNYSIPDNYYQVLAQVESGGDPNAKAKTSSASGLYQFTKSTWQSLGYAWSKVFNPSIQQEAIQKLTSNNADYLSQRGIPVNSVSLYAAHFLGAGTAAKVFGSDPNAKLGSVVGSEVISANPFLKNMTVSEFGDWVAGKFGLSQSGAFGDILNYDPLANPDGTEMDLLSPSTWFDASLIGRSVAIIVGVIFIGLAIAAFVFKNSDAQKIVSNVIPAAG